MMRHRKVCNVPRSLSYGTEWRRKLSIARKLAWQSGKYSRVHSEEWKKKQSAAIKQAWRRGDFTNDIPHELAADNETSFSLAVLRRDKVCRNCGSENNLQAHHIIPRAEGGLNDPANNGISLCAQCHAKEHPGVPESLFYEKSRGPLVSFGVNATTLASNLGVHPRTITRHAKRLGFERHGAHWAFDKALKKAIINSFIRFNCTEGGIIISNVSEDFKNRLRAILVEVAKRKGQQPMTMRDAAYEALVFWMAEKEQEIEYLKEAAALGE